MSSSAQRLELRLAVMALLALLVAQFGATTHAYAHHAPDREPAGRAPAALPVLGRQPPGAARAARIHRA